MGKIDREKKTDRPKERDKKRERRDSALLEAFLVILIFLGFAKL